MNTNILEDYEAIPMTLNKYDKDTIFGIDSEDRYSFLMEVDNIEESLAKAKKNGLEPIGEAPRQGAENTLIAFFHPKDTGGVLLEVVQNK